jgi:hypothetical protein
MHPEKESILIINKIDLLKQKRLLLDLVSIITGGYVNGQKMDIEYPDDHKKKFLNLENLYRTTAKKLNLQIAEEKTADELQLLKLIDELKECENILLKNMEINASASTDVTDKFSSISLQAFTGQNDIAPYKSINDVTPFEFKSDLMETSDWHLYYEKLSKLDLFVREKKSWPYFNQVFMISATENDGIDEFKVFFVFIRKVNLSDFNFQKALRVLSF